MMLNPVDCRLATAVRGVGSFMGSLCDAYRDRTFGPGKKARRPKLERSLEIRGFLTTKQAK